ncbi:MAG: transposase [Lachnospiraceae bacterium]|nr:transposase [Lachnospiraceae bacterium]
MQRLCEHLHLSRGAYYRWLRNPVSLSEKRNQEISEKVSAIHESHPDMGYRRIRDVLEKHQGIDVNDKRILRICRKKQIPHIRPQHHHIISFVCSLMPVCNEQKPSRSEQDCIRAWKPQIRDSDSPHSAGRKEGPFPHLPAYEPALQVL